MLRTFPILAICGSDHWCHHNNSCKRCKGCEGEWGPSLLDHFAGEWDQYPGFTDQFGFGWLIWINEIVMVAFEDEVLDLTSNDAVNNWANLWVAVRDDITDLVIGLGMDDYEIAAMIEWLHTIAIDNDVGSLPTKLAWRTYKPKCTHDYERQ
jgi:hypothetical protein